MIQRLRHAHDHILHALGRHHPELGGAAAFRRFCTPSLSRHRSRDHDQLVARARFHLRQANLVRVATSVGQAQAYVLDPEGAANGDSVLLVHGWTGEAAFMSAFAEHFRRRGYRIVLFDLPAHGLSDGRRTSLFDCAHAVREVAEALGPIRLVVAHSLGGLAALVAGGGRAPMPRAYPFEHYVLVSMPNRFSEVTRKFGAELGLSAAAQRAYERRLERLAHRGIDDFTGSLLLAETGRPALLLHARDDAEVPFANAEQIAAAVGRSAELHAFDDLGHRKILYAPPVVRAASAYVARQTQSPEPRQRQNA
jgi:pimeloyl-ACP methyl ester carboxylesterase